MLMLTSMTRPRMLASLAAAALACTAGLAHAQDLPESHRLKAIPEGAKETAAAIKSAKAGDTITVRGRVADGPEAFADGRAEFLLVDDAAFAAAREKGAGDAAIAAVGSPKNRAVVQLIDSAGKPLTYTVKGRSGLTPGAEVFVVAKVGAAHTGDTPMQLHATGVFVPRGGLPAGALLEAAPADAPDVFDAKKKGLKKGDTVVIKGRIGGSKDPFVKERAVFTLVGRGIKACNEIPGDNCPVPWDYCCIPRKEITAHSATVQFTDDRGMPLRTDIKGRWGIKELSELVVIGTVAEVRGDALVVNAKEFAVTAP